MLDSIEFARGSPNSTWGSLRAKMGHPKPFNLKYVAIGNENCGFRTYRGMCMHSHFVPHLSKLLTKISIRINNYLLIYFPNYYCCYTGNYLKFYEALKKAYPDIKAISNCDGSKQPLDHPADLYDYHVIMIYTLISIISYVLSSVIIFTQIRRRTKKITEVYFC